MRLRGRRRLKMIERLQSLLGGEWGGGFTAGLLPLILLCGECSTTGLLGKETALGRHWLTFPGDRELTGKSTPRVQPPTSLSKA